MHISNKNRFQISSLIGFSFLLFSINLFSSNTNYDATISCHPNINISLNDDCESTLEASDILTVPPHPAEPHVLILTDRYGHVVDGNLVTEEYLWTELTAKVMNTVTGNSCWGKISVEDKNAPDIECSDVTISCSDAGEYLPVHSDNCTSSSLDMIFEVKVPNSCGRNIIKVIQREWVAEDEYGNRSEPCMQTISLERLVFDDIEFPADLELSMNTNLTCNNVKYDENGFPLVDSTGVPTYNGVPLYPAGDLYCSIGVDYEDFVISNTGCVQKFMRTWRVYEGFCMGAGNFAVNPQTIEIADTELPTIVCPPNKTISTSGGPSCSGVTTLDLPTITDDCSELVELDISYTGPFLNDVKTPPTVTLNSGVHPINYTVYDACENSATCSSSITVMDDTNPTAVCDKTTVVSLRSSGTALAPATSFDSGSFDDCDFHKTLIKKSNDVCECALPVYNDMRYMGEREGSYYYMSTIKRYGFEAFSYSTAYGGSIFIADSEEEYDWVVEQAKDISVDSFIIGLKNKTGSTFDWADHSYLTFTRWDVFQPDGLGPNVIANENGLWETFDGSMERAYFVMELSDKCNFSDFVHFCCQDAMEDPEIVLRAIDRFGRVNDCIMKVEIQDKVAPVISCPPHLNIDCDTNIDFNNLDIYGVASATDECLDNITSSYEEDISNCGVGEIIRTFTASDPTGESTCQQVITLNQSFAGGVAPVKWPEDYATADGCAAGDLLPENLPPPNGFPDFSGADCSALTATYKDDIYSFAQSSSDACLKILRSWTVTDECLEGSPGYEPQTYQQTIKVNNDIAPTIQSGCDEEIVVTTDCLEEEVTLNIEAEDDCTIGKALKGFLSIDFNSDGGGTFDVEDSKFDSVVYFTGDFPVGESFALVEFRDECGNRSSCTKIIKVQNSIDPTALCVPGLSSVIQPMDTNGDGKADTNMTMIFARMLDRANDSAMETGSFHECGTDVRFSFSSDLSDTISIFDCDDVGNTNSLDLWVTDTDGNTDICSTVIDIQDDNNWCDSNGNMVEISGAVLTEHHEPIESVQMSLDGSAFESLMTNPEGLYAFPEMNSGGSYILVPSKNVDPLNGVSTLDLVKIQRHILGLEKLDSPYKLIAADVNNSGSITAIDMIELRKLILGVYDEFPENESWRMISGDYNFIDAQNPFTHTFPEEYDIYGINASMNLDFIGVKVGDVDNSAQLNSHEAINTRSNDKSISLLTEEVLLTKGSSKEVYLSLEGLDKIDGFQFELNIDINKVEISGLKPILDHFSTANMNVQKLDEGQIFISWNQNDYAVEKSEALFSIILKAKEDVYVSDILQIQKQDAKITPELYTEGQVLPIELDYFFNELKEDQFKLYQNVPNPWATYTEIKFFAPEKKPYTFSVYDVNGKVIYRQLDVSDSGINKIDLDKSTINQTGVLYYEIIIDHKRMLDKMIILN
ncbi:MAG: T9SS type A sorting domain-containing protein [Saprospiraceae bacterium]|nr:T9SS type A sorting domain-containing protein [Saprospiraceae bacterium]